VNLLKTERLLTARDLERVADAHLCMPEIRDLGSGTLADLGELLLESCERIAAINDRRRYGDAVLAPRQRRERDRRCNELVARELPVFVRTVNALLESGGAVEAALETWQEPTLFGPPDRIVILSLTLDRARVTV
jgi:hypothetical protein